MKYILKIILAIGLTLCMLNTACAKTYELDEGHNGYYVCEDFSGEMTQQAQRIFGKLMLAEDEVICGTLFEEHYRRQPELTGRGGALMAVRRGDKILLMSANTNGKGWSAGIETDSFLPPDAQLWMTGTLRSLYVHLTIGYKDAAYEIRTTGEGGAYLYKYSWQDEAGSRLYMDCDHGAFMLRKEAPDGMDETLAKASAVPDRLAAWTADALPKTAESLYAFERAYPVELNDDEAYITSVNLRESATGKSKTWGEYTAKVKLLAQKPGNDAPWFNVRVGNLEGWASGVYVHGKNTGDRRNAYRAAVAVYPVGKTKTETELLDAHGGNAIMQLNSDSYVHVLGERDGYLHVIVPRGELSWQTDWDGTYGFVRREDIIVGISRTDAIYKN